MGQFDGQQWVWFGLEMLRNAQCRAPHPVANSTVLYRLCSKRSSASHLSKRLLSRVVHLWPLFLYSFRVDGGLFLKAFISPFFSIFYFSIFYFLFLPYFPSYFSLLFLSFPFLSVCRPSHFHLSCVVIYPALFASPLAWVLRSQGGVCCILFYFF